MSAVTACDDDDTDDDGGNVGGNAGEQSTGGASVRGGSSGQTGTGGTRGGSGGATGRAGAPGEAGMDQGGMGGAGGEEFGGAAGDRNVFRPELRPFTEARFAELEVAAGFSIAVYARNLGQARMLGIHGPHVYLTRPTPGDVLRLDDTDDDGVVDASPAVASGYPNVHGIAFAGDTVFLATDKRVLRGTVDANGDFSELAEIIADLPDGGQHPYRTLGVGTDSMLYISVGSSCDACAETNPEHATILRSALDGSTRSIFASGLRNTIGFDWQPDTGVIWGMDHGSDFRGDNLPPEELNRIDAGGNYGWPYCFAEREIDPIIQDPPGTTKDEYCSMTLPSMLENQAHEAPIGMAFYDGTAFPSEYAGDAFVAFHGSWNRFPPTGYKVARIRFDDDGQPVAFEDFVTGFLIEDGNAEFGRPAGIAVAPDGALLFTDDDNGMIYRVTAEP